MLLDYEVELGLVLLEGVIPQQLAEPDYAPRLGYVIANDLSSRSFQSLGRHQTNRYDWWGTAKSFPGFTSVGERMWVPATQRPDSLPCVTLTTTVNGEVRQQQSTANMIYTPKQMLRFVAEAFPDTPLERGDIVLTGTPSGVAIKVPRWRARLADLLGLSRMRILATVIGNYRDDPRFLQPGDRVIVSSPLLGGSSVRVVD